MDLKNLAYDRHYENIEFHWGGSSNNEIYQRGYSDMFATLALAQVRAIQDDFIRQYGYKPNQWKAEELVRRYIKVGLQEAAGG